MAGFRIEGNTSGNVVEVNTLNNLKVVTEVDARNNPSNIGGSRIFCENDQGTITGTPSLSSPEVDVDYRMRVSQDIILDEELFNYTAQNTGKHQYVTTTMVNAWTAGQLTTNSGNSVASGVGTLFQSRAMYPTTGTTTLSCDVEIGFSEQPTTNTIIDFGMFLSGVANPYTPTDGVFFRLSSAGLLGVVVSNGTETQSGVFNFTYLNNKKYQFIAYSSGISAEFWVNDGSGAVLLGRVDKPAGQGRMVMASGLPFSIRHVIVGGAASTIQNALVGAYNIRQGGVQASTTLSTASSRILGSYQGLSGGTMGSLASYANSANPTAAVPTNTTAALGSGLGGQFWETATLAVNTDGIIQSYQVPLGTPNVQGRRLVIRGVGLSSYIQTAITGGPFIAQWSLAFGHTTVSLATAEGVASKAPRRIALPITQVVTAAQAASTIVQQPTAFVDFGDAPIFVNPGEFVALVTKHVGTVATVGTIAHVVTFIYGWE